MNDMPFTDRELTLAAAKVVESISSALPDPEQCEPPFEYSQEFLQKMEQLIRSSHRKERWGKIVQRVASVILALLIGGSVWLAVDVEARAAFVAWVREIYEDCFIYEYFTGKSTAEFGSYEIINLPDGYVKVEDKRNRVTYVQIYDSGDGIITFMYYPINEGLHHKIVNYSDYQCEWKSGYVNEITADIYIFNGEDKPNVIVWIDEFVGMVFEISAYMEAAELVALAESIQAK